MEVGGKENQVKYNAEIQDKLIRFYSAMLALTNYHRIDGFKKKKINVF